MNKNQIISIPQPKLLKDPFGLLNSKKSKTEIKNLRNSGRNGQKLSEFYSNQNDLIEDLLAIPGEEKEDEATLLKLKIAIYGSAMANLFLVALQITAAYLSGSLALLATAADAIMDLMSSVVILLAEHASKSSNVLKYPTGKSRYETTGVIIFAVLMATVSIQVMIESIRTIVGGNKNLLIPLVSYICIGIALFLKSILYVYCQALSQYPTARLFAQDHRNDVIFNIFGLGLSSLGANVAWWIDPAGAILISLLILKSWASTALEHVLLIVGISAEPNFLQKLTYISLTHDDRIMEIDTCKAYHSGNNYIVEVDIVLSPDMTLREAHDIGEDLQMKLESLNNVERAFVHIDYESEHKPEH